MLRHSSFALIGRFSYDQLARGCDKASIPQFSRKRELPSEQATTTMARKMVKTAYLIRVEILADRKIPKDTLVRYLVNGLEHSKSGRLGYEVTVYEDFDLIADDSPPPDASR